MPTPARPRWSSSATVAAEGICREIAEETGLQVKPGQVCYLFSIPNRYLYSGMTIHTLDMFYELHLEGDVSVRADDDVAALTWMPLDQVRPADFGLQSISQGVEKYVALQSSRHD